MSPSAVQATYYGLNLAGGGTGVVILLLTTLLSRYVKKQPVLINLYCACILESYLACILFLSNQYTENEVPKVKIGSSLCMAQAMLFTPTPALLAAAAFCVVFHIFFIVFTINSRTAIASPMPSYRLMMIPYIVYLAILLPILVSTVVSPNSAIPHDLYCFVDIPYVPYLVGVATAIIIFATIILQFGTVVLLWRDHTRVLARTAVDLALVFRVGLFTGYILITFGLSVRAIQDFTARIPDLMVSTIPLAVLVIFGSQKDVLFAWTNILVSIPLDIAHLYLFRSVRRPHRPDSLELRRSRPTHTGQNMASSDSPHASDFMASLEPARYQRLARARARVDSKNGVDLKTWSVPITRQPLGSTGPLSPRRHSWTPDDGARSPKALADAGLVSPSSSAGLLISSLRHEPSTPELYDFTEGYVYHTSSSVDSHSFANSNSPPLSPRSRPIRIPAFSQKTPTSETNPA